MDINIKQDIVKLNSEDPIERRDIAEQYISSEIPDVFVDLLAEKLADEDKGVRDAVSSALIFSDNENIPYSVVPYISSPDISIRNLAGEILLKKGKASLNAMLGNLSLCNADDKKFLIDIMGLIGDGKPVEKILAELSNAEDENLILSCIEALGNLSASESEEELFRIYDINELYKPTIIEALGKIRSAGSFNFILEKYKDEDELTKFSIIEALGSIGDESSFYFLLAELAKLRGPNVWAAISSLKTLKEEYTLDIPYDERLKNAIIKTLDEADVEYKRAAADLIGGYFDEDMLDVCIKIYGTDAEIDMRINEYFQNSSDLFYMKISEVLSQKPYNTKALLQLLKTLFEQNENSVTDYLAEIDRQKLNDSLVKNLENPDEEIRIISMELLFCSDMDTALLFSDTMLQDANMWNRLYLLEVLEKINDEKTIPCISKLAEDSEEMISERAQFLLSEIVEAKIKDQE